MNPSQFPTEKFRLIFVMNTFEKCFTTAKKLQGGISSSTYLYYRLIPFRCTQHSMSAQVVDDVRHPRTLIGGDKLSHLTAQPMLAPIYGQIVHRA